MRTAGRLLVFLCVLCPAVAQERTTTYIARYLSEFPGPQAFRDHSSGLLFYVESDGRHVAAISGDGKLLWNRDPHRDAHLKFYRTENPQIVYIGPVEEADRPTSRKHEKFVAISFNNSQFGLLSIAKGDFLFQGQD